MVLPSTWSRILRAFSDRTIRYVAGLSVKRGLLKLSIRQTIPLSCLTCLGLVRAVVEKPNRLHNGQPILTCPLAVISNIRLIEDGLTTLENPVVTTFRKVMLSFFT